MENKEFHLGDILSVTLGRNLSLKKLDGVCSLLDHMEGRSHSTFEIGEACIRCAPKLIELYPQFSSVNLKDNLHDLVQKLNVVSNTTDSSITSFNKCSDDWVINLTKKLGESFSVPSMSTDNSLDLFKNGINVEGVVTEIQKIRQKNILPSVSLHKI